MTLLPTFLACVRIPEGRLVSSQIGRADRQSFAGKVRRLALGIRKFENALGSERITGEGGEALEDGGRRFSIQLLVEDRFGEVVEGRLAKLHFARTDAVDDGSQNGVGFLQMVDGFAVAVGFGTFFRSSPSVVRQFIMWANVRRNKMPKDEKFHKKGRAKYITSIGVNTYVI